jgi:hypothetical protein
MTIPLAEELLAVYYAVYENDELLPMMEAVRRFGITRPWLRRRIDDGRIATYSSGRDGRVRLVPANELAALINRREAVSTERREGVA